MAMRQSVRRPTLVAGTLIVAFVNAQSPAVTTLIGSGAHGYSETQVNNP